MKDPSPKSQDRRADARARVQPHVREMAAMLADQRQPPTDATGSATTGADQHQPPSAPRLRRRWLRLVWRLGLSLALLGGLVAGGLWLREELNTSRLQSRWLADFARGISFRVQSGATVRPLAPDHGPYDVRLGYARLPGHMSKLLGAGYRVTTQATPSPRLRSLAESGLFNVYQEKTEAGLTVLGAQGHVLQNSRYPRIVYERFEDVPPLVMRTLMFVEDREVLDVRLPYKNPVFDWERLAKAVGLRALNSVGGHSPSIGASTLATQLEKFRHSPDGLTHSAKDKLLQMASASLRVYAHGPNTIAVRRRLIVDYLNSLPLAALPGYGEVSSLGDGLTAWYGTDFATANRLLADPAAPPAAQARYFKQVLSLILAVRRPSAYLGADGRPLAALTDSYVRVMANAGVITPALRDAALKVHLTKRNRTGERPLIDFSAQKGTNLVRSRLLGMLGERSFYELDRLDLTVQSTLHGATQNSVTQFLSTLHDPAVIEALNLNGKRLLANDDPTKLIYSLTLYERGAGANLVRVNADNLAQPFDINAGAKLDLGSTAKLRTLITWLDLIGQAHEKYARQSPVALAALQVHPRDRLTRWVVDYLLANPQADMTATLHAALLREYSASTGQTFFTGGGAHTFGNFERSDNGRMLTVQEAVRRSVNLVFIRVMREVVDHYLYRAPSTTARLLETQDPGRADYLQRFADREGSVYMRRFYRKYTGKRPDEALRALLDGVRVTPRAVATVVRTVSPGANVAELKAWLQLYVPEQPQSAADVAALYEKYTPANFDLNDRGYLARVHPLELWLLEYLRGHPQATMREVLTASASARQEVYHWLMKTSRRRAQDRRILDLLEIEAFQEIHAQWHRLGYPFASLTPSLATAIGSSGDRPAALAELMGIIVNHGVRLPTVLIEALHFAKATPYEVNLQRAPDQGERVLAAQVSDVVHDAILEVVANGTAKALLPALVRADGTSHLVGGKTGTGDHRFEVYSAPGRLVESRVVNRVAVFVFYIDDRFFGTLTAFVPGAQAAQYEFTSGLPVRLLGALMPRLGPLLGDPPAAIAADGTAPAPLRPAPAAPPTPEPVAD